MSLRSTQQLLQSIIHCLYLSCTSITYSKRYCKIAHVWSSNLKKIISRRGIKKISKLASLQTNIWMLSHYPCVKRSTFYSQSYITSIQAAYYLHRTDNAQLLMFEHPILKICNAQRNKKIISKLAWYKPIYECLNVCLRIQHSKFYSQSYIASFEST